MIQIDPNPQVTVTLSVSYTGGEWVIFNAGTGTVYITDLPAITGSMEDLSIGQAYGL
jgi:hypothetical protein